MALDSSAASTPAPSPPPAFSSTTRLKTQPPPASTTNPRANLQSSASTDSLRHLQMRVGKPALKSRLSASMDPEKIEAIISQLIQQDEERLKHRRSLPSVNADAEENDQIFPLKSPFFDFALEYYKESQMRVSLCFSSSRFAIHSERVAPIVDGSGRTGKCLAQRANLATTTERSDHHQDSADERSSLPSALGRASWVLWKRSRSESHHLSSVRTSPPLFRRQGKHRRVRVGKELADQPLREWDTAERSDHVSTVC